MNSPPQPVPPDFSADKPILGFKYQLRYALRLLYDAQRLYGSDAAIAIEQIDDIDVHAANKLTKLVQTKNTATVLTNSSAAVWKTLRIWSEAIQLRKVDPTTIDSFELVATSPNPADDSAIVNLLQQGTEADRREALRQLRDLAAAKRNQQTLGKAYRAFHDLPARAQEELVARIKVHTSAPTFEQLDGLIQNQIVHGPPGKLKAFSMVLFGRWDQLLEAHLRERKQTKVTWLELQSVLHDISLEFEEDNLPTVFDEMLRDALPTISDRQRIFMKQLVAIGATDPQCQRALGFYLKSTRLLGFWQRNILVRPDEVLTHSKRLVDECELQHEAAVANPQLASVPRQEIGQRIYHWAITEAAHQESLRIRRRCTDPDVIRGCFQVLADRPKIGWHPDWNTMFGSTSTGV